MLILHLLFGLAVAALIPLSLLWLAIYFAKVNEQNSIIKNDSKLNKLKYEIQNDDNDGWMKLHYQELYDKRKNELKNITNTSK